MGQWNRVKSGKNNRARAGLGLCATIQ